MTKPILTFYTRNGCHLCEQAKTIIDELKRELDFTYEECDIERKDKWTELYGLMIPVVMKDGIEVQYGNIDKETLRKAFS